MAYVHGRVAEMSTVPSGPGDMLQFAAASAYQCGKRVQRGSDVSSLSLVLLKELSYFSLYSGSL